MSAGKLLNTFDDIKTFMDSLVSGDYLLKSETNYHAAQGRNMLLTTTELNKLVDLPVITQEQVTQFTEAYNRGDWNAAIADNDTTNDASKIASASAVYNLRGMIDNINALIASDDVNLDELQEIVDFIKTNKQQLESLNIGNISGLQAALDTKVTQVAGKGLSTNDLTNDLLDKINEAHTWGDPHAVFAKLDGSNMPFAANVEAPNLKVSDWGGWVGFHPDLAALKFDTLVSEMKLYGSYTINLNSNGYGGRNFNVQNNGTDLYRIDVDAPNHYFSGGLRVHQDQLNDFSLFIGRYNAPNVGLLTIRENDAWGGSGYGGAEIASFGRDLILSVDQGTTANLKVTSAGTLVDNKLSIDTSLSHSGDTQNNLATALHISNSNTTPGNYSAISFGQHPEHSNGMSKLGIQYKDRTGGSEDQEFFIGTLFGGQYKERFRISGDFTKFYASATGLEKRRLTLNMTTSGLAQFYNYDEGTPGFHEVELGGTSTPGTGLVIDENGHAVAKGYIQSDSIYGFVIGGLAGSPRIQHISGGFTFLNTGNSWAHVNMNSINLSANVSSATSPALRLGAAATGFYSAGGDMGVAHDGLELFHFGAEGLKSVATGGALIKQTAANSVNPVFSFLGDEDTGLGRQSDDRLSLIAGGNEVMRINGNNPLDMSVDVYGSLRLLSGKASINIIGSHSFWAANNGAFYLRNEAEAQPLRLQVNNSGSTETRIEANVLGGQLYGDWTVNNGQLQIANQGSAANPALSIGNGGTGLYEVSDNVLGFATSGSSRFYINSLGFNSSVGGTGALISRLGATATHPVFSFVGDQNTGIGTAGADQLSLIAGGTELARFENTAITLNKGLHVSGGASRFDADITVTQSVEGIVLEKGSSKARINILGGSDDLLRIGAISGINKVHLGTAGTPNALVYQDSNGFHLAAAMRITQQGSSDGIYLTGNAAHISHRPDIKFAKRGPEGGAIQSGANWLGSLTWHAYDGSTENNAWEIRPISDASGVANTNSEFSIRQAGSEAFLLTEGRAEVYGNEVIHAGNLDVLVDGSFLKTNASDSFTVSDWQITANTSQGNDNAILTMAGGGSPSPSRGAYFHLFGDNHHNNAGNLILSSGDSGNIHLYGDSVFHDSVDIQGKLSAVSTATHHLQTTGDKKAIIHLRPSDTRTGIQPVILYRGSVESAANYLMTSGTSTYFATYDSAVPTNQSNMVKITASNTLEPKIFIGDSSSTGARGYINGHEMIHAGNIGTYTSAESDTLQSVTDRGNTTSNDVTVANLVTQNQLIIGDSGLLSGPVGQKSIRLASKARLQTYEPVIGDDWVILSRNLYHDTSYNPRYIAEDTAEAISLRKDGITFQFAQSNPADSLLTTVTAPLHLKPEEVVVGNAMTVEGVATFAGVVTVNAPINTTDSLTITKAGGTIEVASPNKGGFGAFEKGAIHGSLDDDNSASWLLTANQENANDTWYGIQVHDNSASGILRAYAGTNYIELNATGLNYNGALLATQSWTNSQGYATEVWVTAQGYLSTESDTLQSVTGRGATTTHHLTMPELSVQNFLTVASAGSVALGGAQRPLGLQSDTDHVAIAITENTGGESFGIGVDVDGSLKMYNSSASVVHTTFHDNGQLITEQDVVAKRDLISHTDLRLTRTDNTPAIVVYNNNGFRIVSSSGQAATLNVTSGGNLTLNTNSLATQSWTNSQGFATENWVIAQGYASEAGVIANFAARAGDLGQSFAANILRLQNREDSDLSSSGQIAYDANDGDAPSSLGNFNSTHPVGLYIHDGVDVRRIWNTDHFTGTHVANWQTAYGWGDHAGLYLPLSGGTLSGDVNFNGDMRVNVAGQNLYLDGDTTNRDTIVWTQSGANRWKLRFNGADLDFYPESGAGELRYNGEEVATRDWVNAQNFSSSVAFANLTSKTSGTGNYSTNGYLIAGRGEGGVALTNNDGYGNANVTFNHVDGIAEQNGNAARIEVNTDSTTGAYMSFELSDGLTAGVATSLGERLKIETDLITSYESLMLIGSGRSVSVTSPNDAGWGAWERGAFHSSIDNNSNAAWILTADQEDAGNVKYGVQVLNTGQEMRLYSASNYLGITSSGINFNGSPISANGGDAASLGGQPANKYARTDISESFAGSVTVGGTVLVDKVNARTGQQLVLNAGESWSLASGQDSEFVYINAESGLQINASPDNWSSGWNARVTHTLGHNASSIGTSLSVQGAMSAMAGNSGGYRLASSNDAISLPSGFSIISADNAYYMSALDDSMGLVPLYIGSGLNVFNGDSVAGNNLTVNQNLTVQGTSSLKGQTTVEGDLIVQDGQNIRVGIGEGILLYGSNDRHHSIQSRDLSGNPNDDIRINSFGGLYINLDSNGNNTSGADFVIGRHGGTGSMSDRILSIYENTRHASFSSRVSVGEHLLATGNVYASGAQGFVFGASTGEGEYIQRTGNDIKVVAGGSERLKVSNSGVNVTGNVSITGTITSTKEGSYTPRYDTAFHVLQSNYWYSHTGSDLMYLGESGNTVYSRGLLTFLHGDSGTLFQSRNASATNSPVQFQARHSGGHTILDNLRGNLYLDATSSVYLRYNGSNKLQTASAGGTLIGTWNATTNLQVGGSTVWHAGNDGAGSGLRADVLESGSIGDLNTAWQDLGASQTMGLQVFRYSGGASNKPVSSNNANWLMNIYSHTGSGGSYPYGHQIAAGDTEDLYVRKVSNGSFGNWRKLLHSGNYASYAVPKTGGTFTGTVSAANLQISGANVATQSWVTGRGYITGNQTITLSGDISGSGTTSISTTIGANAVHGSMINDDAISSQPPLTSSVSGSDELLISDSGALKKTSVSNLQSHFTSSFDSRYIQPGDNGTRPETKYANFTQYATETIRAQFSVSASDWYEVSGMLWMRTDGGGYLRVYCGVSSNGWNTNSKLPANATMHYNDNPISPNYEAVNFTFRIKLDAGTNYLAFLNSLSTGAGDPKAGVGIWANSVELNSSYVKVQRIVEYDPSLPPM